MGSTAFFHLLSIIIILKSQVKTVRFNFIVCSTRVINRLLWGLTTLSQRASGAQVLLKLAQQDQTAQVRSGDGPEGKALQKKPHWRNLSFQSPARLTAWGSSDARYASDKNILLFRRNFEIMMPCSIFTSLTHHSQSTNANKNTCSYFLIQIF